jgi:Family of unknown function (DUF5947)
MSVGARPEDRHGRRLMAEAITTRRRTQTVSSLRSRAQGAGAPGRLQPDPDLEYCDICGVTIPPDHRHLLHLVERRIVCSCEACWAMRSGEGDYRPTGSRTVWLPDLNVPDELWASFQIPIGLAFFMRSTVTGCVVAMYPSPAGATESELHFDAWARMCELNPVLADMESDIEGLIVNRLSEPAVYAIAPIDRCYALTGAIKATWEGISGGTGVNHAVTRFFDELRVEAVDE